jgi:hypothetical protein
VEEFAAAPDKCSRKEQRNGPQTGGEGAIEIDLFTSSDMEQGHCDQSSGQPPDLAYQDQHWQAVARAGQKVGASSNYGSDRYPG